MPIVSVSLNKSMLSALDRLQSEEGFSGRSEVMRTALRMLLEENRKHAELEGRVECVLIVIHEHRSCGEVVKIQHKFIDAIVTHLHSIVEGEKCLEIFVLRGGADEVRGMYKEFQKNKHISYTKLVQT